MRRTLFLIVTLCCSAMPTLASAAACDSQELLDDLQWAIMDNGQRCASHQAFEDLINGACHRDTNQMNQGFTNCHPYDGQSELDNWNSCPVGARQNLAIKTAFEWHALTPSRVRPPSLDEAKETLKKSRLPRRAQTLTSRRPVTLRSLVTSRSLITSRSLGIAASRSVGCPAATRRPRLWS